MYYIYCNALDRKGFQVITVPEDEEGINAERLDALHSEGRYRITGVPAGTYTLAVWTDGETRETRRVTVPEGEDAVEADFGVR